MGSLGIAWKFALAQGILFPAIIEAGLPAQDGPIGVMLAEHEQGRVYVKAMQAAAQKLESGDTAARLDLIKAARGYTALLRQHIIKEDRILFSTASQFIPVSQQEQVVEDFEHVEHEETGEGVHEKYLALAGALQKELIS